MLPSQAMRDEEVEDLAGLESSMARHDVDALVGTQEQSSLVRVGGSDHVATGTL